MDKYQTFWPRFFALFLDGIVLSLLGACLDFIPRGDSGPWLFVYSLVRSNFQYAYSVIMVGRYGQTLGKMALGVKVVDNDTEESIGYHQAFMREAIPIALVSVSIIGSTILLGGEDMRIYELSMLEYVLLFLPSGMLGIWAILEIVTMLMDPKSRALHDKVADTVVVKV